MNVSAQLTEEQMSTEAQDPRFSPPDVAPGPSSVEAQRARNTDGVYLEPAGRDREDEFLALVRRSRSLHRPWVNPPESRVAFRRYLEKLSQPQNAGYFVCEPEGPLAGIININEMILGSMCSGALGYYGFSPSHGKGLMSAGLALVLRRAFTHHGLHRVEANVQPDNVRSRRLVERYGFHFEGVARGLLKVGSQWRDHERWALTVEDWREIRSKKKS